MCVDVRIIRPTYRREFQGSYDEIQNERGCELADACLGSVVSLGSIWAGVDPMILLRLRLFLVFGRGLVLGI